MNDTITKIVALLFEDLTRPPLSMMKYCKTVRSAMPT